MADNTPDPDTPMRVRGVGRLRPGNYVSLSYTSPRIKRGFERGRQGEIESSETLPDGRPRFVFYDDHRERQIEVVIGETAGESEVRTLGDRDTSLGTPLRVEVHEGVDSVEEGMSESMTTQIMEGRYPGYVAVAGIKWNESILEWFNWSEKHS